MAHAQAWVKEHFEPQPKEREDSLTYFVIAGVAYREYTYSADRMKLSPLRFADWAKVVRAQMPKVRSVMWKGYPTFIGVSFYKDHIGGHLVFGI